MREARGKVFGLAEESSASVQAWVLTNLDSPWLPYAKKELLGQLPLQWAPVSDIISWDLKLHECFPGQDFMPLIL